MRERQLRQGFANVKRAVMCAALTKIYQCLNALRALENLSLRSLFAKFEPSTCFYGHYKSPVSRDLS